MYSKFAIFFHNLSLNQVNKSHDDMKLNIPTWKLLFYRITKIIYSIIPVPDWLSRGTFVLKFDYRLLFNCCIFHNMTVHISIQVHEMSVI